MKSILLIFLCVAATSRLGAHDSLYNTAEIHLTSADSVRIHFSIHAPEVLIDSEKDTIDLGDDWLAALDDDTISTLIDRSRKFVLQNFRLAIGDLVPLKKFALQFETPDQIRTTQRENGPRPGCLLATLTFPNPGGDLRLSYTTEAEKRLLLVVIRPAAFPKTHDLASGEERAISLPSPPAPSEKPLAFAPAIELVSQREFLTISKP